MTGVDFETLENVVGDVAHTGPAIKGALSFMMKYLSKQKMAEVMHSGDHQLHLSSLILEHKEVKKLLGGLHTTLVENYAQLHEARDVLDEKLTSLGAMAVLEKVSLANSISTWARKSTAYKHAVVRQSDWARLGLALRDGKLVPIKETLGCPSEQTLVAPRSHGDTGRLDKEGESDDELCESLPQVRFDDIKSLELHEMQDLVSDGSGPSVPSKKPNRIGNLFKGKGRATEPA
ncbi:hypothetical protein V8D89_013134 [Ganoderma adspersum]